MKSKSRVIWGLILVAAGVLFCCKELDLLPFDLFFDGWWTLFLIVPGAVGLVTKQNKGENAVLLLVGVALLLACLDVISFGLLWKLFLPCVIILAGLKLIFGAGRAAKAKQIEEAIPQGERGPTFFACFSGQDARFDGQIFSGAELCGIFGGVKCDLRGAVIEKDAVIRASAIFGGVDILVPPGVVVKTSVTSIFGGTDNKAVCGLKEAPTLYVTGLCMFGGIEIK